MFGNTLPVIKNYNNSCEIIQHYLNNETERLDIVDRLRNIVDNNYSPASMINRMLSELYY